MLEIKDGKFYLNGEEFRIYSGCIHYFRVPEALWRDRLAKLKAAGLNTVETYVAWNMHEAKRGEYVFSGRADIVKFIKTAQELGFMSFCVPVPISARNGTWAACPPGYWRTKTWSCAA